VRVLLLSNTYPPADISGVGVLVAELAGELRRRGHGAAVLTRRAPAGDPGVFGVRGPKVLFPLLAALRFARLPGHPFDVVHVHESDGVFVALLVRLWRRLRRPAGRARVVATLHVSYVAERRAVRPVRAGRQVVSRPTGSERVFAWLRAPLHAALGRLTARLADSVVALSAAAVGELERDYGVRPAAVVPNGVPLPATTPAGGRPSADGRRQAAPLHAEDGTQNPIEERVGADTSGESEMPVRTGTILFIGRLRTRKAVAVLLAAFARVRARLPEARLVLVGDGEQRTALAAQVAALQIDGAVELAGALGRAATEERLASADVLCLPSTYEGFPLVVLEAMAAGLPVVATAVAGVPEAVEHGVTGLLVPPEDDVALAAALVAVLADPAGARAMGAAGRQRVVERFTIATAAAAYLEVWERLLAEGPPPGP
jgi:glycosyltransferase involved in cell wall biosynthesis